ncbi:MAG: sulfur carrier protein ThiS adenylyltransferase ThiF [Dehalobacter sp.]|nr:sulfur carrier protein ThiS adenylyltransferase ThiF [Dehalobacter sp.]
MVDLNAALFSKHDPAVVSVLKAAKVGIAGVGGLGSNVAISLARAGVGTLVLTDFDVVEPSNLNRQQYFIDQIGKSKVDALRENLVRINPFSTYEIHHLKLCAGDIPQIYSNVEILVEAFDEVEMKLMLVEAWVAKFPNRPLIVGSGIAGYGGNNDCRTERIFGQVYVCGDGKSDAGLIPPIAPKVALIAAMQANLVLELLLSH